MIYTSALVTDNTYIFHDQLFSKDKNYFSEICCLSYHITGKGFYRYEAPNAKEPYDDPWMTDFLEDYRRKRGIQTRRISTNV